MARELVRKLPIIEQIATHFLVIGFAPMFEIKRVPPRSELYKYRDYGG